MIFIVCDKFAVRQHNWRSILAHTEIHYEILREGLITKIDYRDIIFIYTVEKQDKLALLVPRVFNLLETIMKTWNTPSATEMRFGFEITMYVLNK